MESATKSTFAVFHFLMRHPSAKTVTLQREQLLFSHLKTAAWLLCTSLLQVYKRIHVEIQIHELNTSYARPSLLSNSVSRYCKVESKKLLVVCTPTHSTKISRSITTAW